MDEDGDEERGEQAFVRIPGITGPTDVEQRFSYALDDGFRENGFGEYRRRRFELTGEHREIVYCELEIGLIRPVRGMNFLREFLARRGCPQGTEIFYPKDGVYLTDTFNGAEWVLGNPNATMHPNSEG